MGSDNFTNEEKTVIEELKIIIENRDEKALDLIFQDEHPIDLAIAIDEFEKDDLIILFSLLDSERTSKILEQSDEDLQITIMEFLENRRILEVFSYMQKDDIVDILGDLPTNRRKKILSLMKDGDKNIISELLGYDEDTAGGIMTTAFLEFRQNISVKKALDKIKYIAPVTEIIEYIYITNAQKQLVGIVDLRDILINKDNTLLEEIMKDNIIYVDADLDKKEVALTVSKYDLKAIPVVNSKNRLLGVITVDDIIDVIFEEHSEDILQIGGVGKDAEINTGLVESVKQRLPWLFINLITAFLAAITIGLFQSTIDKVVILSAIMPIVAGMGGNAGTQALSIAVRGIALDEIELETAWPALFKEIQVGIFNGAAIGIVAGGVLFFYTGNPYLGVILFAALIINLTIAGFSGVLIPLIIKKMELDPALASSIFLTTATDVFGFFAFLGLAKLFLPFLI